VRRSVLSMTAVFCLIISGCVSMPYEPYARAVKVAPNKGGVIAMHATYRAEDKQRALGMMAENCGNKKPEVTEEGEVVVGQTTKSNDNHYYNGASQQSGTFLFQQPTAQTASQSSVTQDKEWQMTYKCI
jgi:hypothetical protein